MDKSYKGLDPSAQDSGLQPAQTGPLTEPGNPDGNETSISPLPLFVSQPSFADTADTTVEGDSQIADVTMTDLDCLKDKHFANDPEVPQPPLQGPATDTTLKEVHANGAETGSLSKLTGFKFKPSYASLLEASNPMQDSPKTLETPLVVRQSIPLLGCAPTCGITVERLRNTSIDDYVDAVEHITGKKSVIFAGQSPEDPKYATMFLSTPALVKKLANQGIKIRRSWLCVTPYQQPATKVIVSGVLPFIADQQIIEACREYGDSVYPQLRRIPAGVRSPQLAGILSFRRELLIVLHKDKPLPDEVAVFANGIVHKLSLSTDGVMCYRCSRRGHLANNCKTVLPNKEQQQHLTGRNPPPQGHSSQTSSTDIAPTKPQWPQFCAMPPLRTTVLKMQNGTGSISTISKQDNNPPHSDTLWKVASRNKSNDNNNKIKNKTVNFNVTPIKTPVSKPSSGNSEGMSEFSKGGVKNTSSASAPKNVTKCSPPNQLPTPQVVFNNDDDDDDDNDNEGSEELSDQNQAILSGTGKRKKREKRKRKKIALEKATRTDIIEPIDNHENPLGKDKGHRAKKGHNISDPNALSSNEKDKIHNSVEGNLWPESDEGRLPSQPTLDNEACCKITSSLLNKLTNLRATKRRKVIEDFLNEHPLLVQIISKAQSHKQDLKPGDASTKTLNRVKDEIKIIRGRASRMKDPKAN